MTGRRQLPGRMPAPWWAAAILALAWLLIPALTDAWTGPAASSPIAEPAIPMPAGTGDPVPIAYRRP